MSQTPPEILSPMIFAEKWNAMLTLQELLKAQRVCLFITRNKKMILSLWCLIENNEGVNRKVGLGKSQVSCNCLGIKWEVRQSLLQLLGKRKHRITISDSLEKQAEILQSLFFLFLTQNAQIVLQNISTRSWNQVSFVLMKNEDACPYIIWHNCLLWRFGNFFCHVICLCPCICLCLCVTKISSDTTVSSGALAVIVISFVFVFIFVCVFVFVLTALWQNYCSMTWGCLGRGGDSLSLWHEEGGRRHVWG